MLAAYFSHGLDIGDFDVLRQIANDIGVDADALATAVSSGKHLPMLEKTKDDAAGLGATGVPTFFLNDKRSIVGAQSLDVFRKTLRSEL